MEVIWVIENVLKTQEFYNRRRTSLLIASIGLWKKYHPKHHTVLYCDSITFDLLNNLNVLHLWDEIRDLNYPDKIDRKTFWSTCKTKIISETKIPLLVVDHDFLIFKNIDEHLKNEVIYSYDEEDHGWYPTENDRYVLKLNNKISRKLDLAANVSLFYLPNPKFANEYGKQTLQNHIEFTKMGVTDTGYMILSEQLMLKENLIDQNIPYKTLCNGIFSNSGGSFVYEGKLEEKHWIKTHEHGIWNYEEYSLYCKHYGVLEEVMDQKELDYVFRCINACKKVDIELLKEKVYELRS
tara:strand:- start:5394 stop:6278 length:885 start_codon:yes stop_codon:yes gene_type:complete